MDTHPELQAAVERAAAAIREADALLIGAGAGMGVDSGLPDFRGDEGFWRAYPPFRGRRFAEMSNPRWFRTDPGQAWGFFGHRLDLYRSTVPHAGFDVLRRRAKEKPLGCFVFTSNVDGQFTKAGFDQERILECHGSIHYLQCSHLCSEDIWPAGDLKVEVDAETIRAAPPFPACPRCGNVARPNILMFGDFDWLSSRCDRQHARYGRWLEATRGKRIAAIELGAGTAIPTVRLECTQRAGVLVRVNPREPQTPPGGIALPAGALEAILRIDEAL